MNTPTVMTHVQYSDGHATVPGADTGLGAWLPLTDEQRIGCACLDCDRQFYYNSAKCGVGRAELADGVMWPVYVCPDCYTDRLRDHVDYYRPQS